MGEEERCVHLHSHRLLELPTVLNLIHEISTVYKLHDKAPHSRTLGAHALRTQFRFSLRFEDRFFDPNADRGDDGSPNILGIIGFFAVALEKCE